MGTVKDALIFKKLSTEIPNPKQIEFFESEARYTLYGGARGGGKSWAGRRKAVLLCIDNDGLCGLLLRRTMPELLNNHIIPLQKELHGYAEWKEKQKAFVFPNGSRLILGYCDNDNDVQQFQGVEYDFIIFEEATNFKEQWILDIQSSMRAPKPGGFRTRVYYTANPGGVSHDYFKRLFIDKVYIGDEKPENYKFISATVYDNNVLMENDPSYVEYLKTLPEARRKAWLYGDWDIFEGAFFAEFRSTPKPYKEAFNTHVCEPFDIPPSWHIYRSFDWGYSKPFSCDWWAVDYDGRAYLILQLYGCMTDSHGAPLPDTGVKWTADRVFSEVAKMEREHKWLRGKLITGVADPAIWAEDGGDAIIASADKHQVFFSKADHTRLPGWMQVRYRLAFDKDGRPMVYFFSTCKHAIRTLPLLQYSETNPEDLNTKQEDHFADSFRYFCMSHPIEPREPIENIKKPLGPLDKTRRVERFDY